VNDREKAAARIRALKAMTVENGCTEAEALIAAEKLAKALSDYNMTLDEADLRASPFDKQTYDRASVVGTRLWKPAMAIGKLTNTKVWRAGPCAMSFLGLSHEVEVAVYLLRICDQAMQTEVERLYRTMRHLPPIRKAARVLPFVEGMSDRLYARIMAMVPVQPPGNGLVVVRNALIDSELARRGIELEDNGPRRRLTGRGYDEGRAAADKVALNPGVTGGASALKLS
jgi:hypothetical protein